MQKGNNRGAFVEKGMMREKLTLHDILWFLGALVASYPFDNTPNSIFSTVLSTPSLTPDDDVFKHMAGIYSFNHGR